MSAVGASGTAVAAMMDVTPSPVVPMSESAPAVVPSVQVTTASPLASVVLVAALTDPPPERTVHVTTAPATGEPLWSVR